MSQSLGFALLCESGGRVKEVLAWEASLGERPWLGMPVASLFGPDLVTDLLDLLEEGNGEQRRVVAARSLGDSPGPWALEAWPLAGSCLLAGLRNLVAAPGEEEALLDELSRLNNELLDGERRLAKSLAELCRLEGIRTRFLGMAAHDIKGPLSSIYGYSQAASADLGLGGGPEERAAVALFFQKAQASLEAIMGLVDDLLDASALESGRPHLELADLDFAAMAANCLLRAGPQAAAKGIELRLEGRETPLVVHGDAFQLERCLFNLLHNAIKFSHRGQAVTLRIEAEEGWARALVIDEGVGMSAEDQTRLFQPFGAFGRRGTEGEKSTGLGLYISQELARAQGGAIGLESAPDRGTRASLRMPILKRGN